MMTPLNDSNEHVRLEKSVISEIRKTEKGKSYIQSPANKRNINYPSNQGAAPLPLKTSQLEVAVK